MNSFLAEKSVPYEIQENILEFIIETNEESYWQLVYKNKFSKEILSKIDIKMYFKKYILSNINQGWRLTGIVNDCPCIFCYELGHLEPNPVCCNCFLRQPCGNCYWYNIDIFNSGNGCDCSKELVYINWKQIKPFLRNGYKYNTYYDFIHGKDWKDSLLEQLHIIELLQQYI
jgi:hypothetical protein